MTPQDWEPRYMQGADLFNLGHYFAAHEVWEELWRDCPAEPRLFYQSLIQAAVALYHHERGNRLGAERLARVGEQKARGYPCPFLGMDHQEFWASVHRVIFDQATERPLVRLCHPAEVLGWNES